MLLMVAAVMQLPAIGQNRQDSVRLEYIYLLNADVVSYSEFLLPGAQVLTGNVVLRHDSMYMYCDSALLFRETNSFKAFDNIRVEQGDTLFMYGDSLYYNGNTRLAQLRDNVRLENRTMVLLTDSLNYDRNLNLGYFFDGGTLLDENNTLKSDYGQFEPDRNLASFFGKVRLESTDYNMKSDTMYYNTETHMAMFNTRTTISSDDYIIFTTRGNFNTDSRSAVLLDRSQIDQKTGESRMTGDSILFDDNNGILRAFGSVLLNDFKDHADVSGDYVYCNRGNDSIVVTDRALAMEYSSGDTMYLHADTIRLQTYWNEAHDTVVDRHVRAFNRVKVFRYDMQMIADSMQISSADSSMTLYGDPIVWSEGQQILGEKIIAYMNDSTIDWAHVIGQALFVQQVDSTCYNQISGREMRAWFDGQGQLEHANVKGNVLVVFYPMDDDSTMIGMNTTEASALNAYFKERQIETISIPGKSSGILYPMDQIDSNKKYLPSFNWFEHLRPYAPDDVFSWRTKRGEEKLKKGGQKTVPLPTLNR